MKMEETTLDNLHRFGMSNAPRWIKGADASDARQSRRKELIAVRRRVSEGLGGPGAHPEARAWGRIDEGITEKIKERSYEQTRVK
jgi:hypothetical protein